MKKVTQIFYWIITVLLMIVAGLTAVSAFDLPKGYRLYVVQSGSMEPTIPVESIVVVQKQNEYFVKDIITFKAAADRNNLRPKITTTHRIDKIEEKDGQKIITTKGDANKTADIKPIDQGLVIGKVMFFVPLIGRVVSFARTQIGFIGLIIIPATIIIYSELMSIKEETKRLLKERKTRKLNLVEKTEVEIGEAEMEIEKDIKKIVRKKSVHKGQK